MAQTLDSHPDVLVLGGGGTLGIAWLRGLVAGLHGEGIDLRRSEYFVGTSAGSVVATYLAEGADPEVIEAVPAARGGATATTGPISAAAAALMRATATATVPLAPLAFALGRPGGAAIRAAMLSATPPTTRSFDDLRRELERLGVRFDGRLRVTAVDKRRGTRVVFGAPGAPRASVADAVMASCSVPWMVSPVTIGGREYVDGGAWSPSNIDVAPVGRGSEILALLPVGGRGARARTGLLGAMRRAAAAAALAEVQVLRARGAKVRVVHPDANAVTAMGPDFFDDARRQDALEAGFAQGHALAGG